MSDINQAIRQMNRMDDLTAIDSPIHSLHPLGKLVTTTIYIMVVVSFHKYDLSGAAAMILYPALMFALSTIPPGACFYQMRYVMPLVCAVGLFNPFFDKTPMLALGRLTITGGMISMVTLMLKGVLCLTASFFLGMLVLTLRGGFDMSRGARIEMMALLAVITVMAFVQHRGNIDRLLHGCERKTYLKKRG